MRPLLLSLAACVLLLGAVWAQTAGEGGGMPQLPVGQTFKQFEFPYYQDGKLKATLYADQATGITLNRAETSDLKITVYDTVTTTITSPKADLYVNEQKMRTSHSVLIARSDMDASSQDCDFDLKTKKYLLRTKVKVVLKHFDLNMSPGNPASPDAAQAPAAAIPPAPETAPMSAIPVPPAPHPASSNTGSLLDSPGGYAQTNAAPASAPASK